MGRAAAVAAAGRGWRVALSGRRADRLEETAGLVDRAGGPSLVLPLDARDVDSVSRGHAAIDERWGSVTDLVLSAGLNMPARYWRDQSIADFTEVVATNLTGVAAMVDAVLPDLRNSAGGQVVVVSSYAAWRFSPHAGVAYSRQQDRARRAVRDAQRAGGAARRPGLPPLPRRGGQRLPGLRPSVPDENARAQMLTPTTSPARCCSCCSRRPTFASTSW